MNNTLPGPLVTWIKKLENQHPASISIQTLQQCQRCSGFTIYFSILSEVEAGNTSSTPKTQVFREKPNMEKNTHTHTHTAWKTNKDQTYINIIKANSSEKRINKLGSRSCVSSTFFKVCTTSSKVATSTDPPPLSCRATSRPTCLGNINLWFPIFSNLIPFILLSLY